MKTEIRGQRSGVRLQKSGLRFRFACHAAALCAGWVLLIDNSACAQSVILTTGQTIETLGVRRQGDVIMAKVQVGAGSGEVGYHLPQIAKIEFPEPRALKTASDLLGQGQPQKALAEIEPVVAYYTPFKDVPGSWWSQAALIKVSVLGALQKEADAEALATEIQKSATDPEAARGAQLRLVSVLIRKGNFDKALAICDSAIKDSTDRTVLANAWIGKGDAFLGQKRADDALLAYLHVPVFYHDESSLLPAALLGSARSYRRLDDKENAKKAFNEVITTFPKSAEATAAQSELQKMQKQ